MEKIMKKISPFELTNLMGGYTYSSCAEVQFAANTHHAPSKPSPEELEEEERFWDDWRNEFDRLCK